MLNIILKMKYGSKLETYISWQHFHSSVKQFITRVLHVSTSEQVPDDKSVLFPGILYFRRVLGK